MMTVEKFFHLYANVPLADRMTVINFNEFGIMTLNDAYKRVHDDEERMRTLRLEQDRLIKACEEYLKRNQA